LFDLAAVAIVAVLVTNAFTLPRWRLLVRAGE
jgi:hypothetical protein